MVRDEALLPDANMLVCLSAACQLCETKAVMMNHRGIPPHQCNTWPRQFIKYFIAA